MKGFNIHVEKTSTGYSAWFKPSNNVLIASTGRWIPELLDNLKEAWKLSRQKEKNDMYSKKKRKKPVKTN